MKDDQFVMSVRQAFVSAILQKSPKIAKNPNILIFSQPIFLPEGQKDQLGISKQGLKIGDFHSGVLVSFSFFSSVNNAPL